MNRRQPRFSVARAQPQILGTEAFRKKFLGCIGRHPHTLLVVSPFIGKPPPYGKVEKLASHLFAHRCESFVMVTRPPAEGGRDSGGAAVLSTPEAERLTDLGVELLIRPQGLHSKIYQFCFREGDRASFVGSANFTAAGFESNNETVALFLDRVDNGRVSRRLGELTGHRSEEYRHWKVRQRRS